METVRFNILYTKMIREAMRRHGLSIRQVAEGAGCSREHMRRIASGDCAVSQELNRRLCRVLSLNEGRAWRLQSEAVNLRMFHLLGGELQPPNDPTMLRLWSRLSRNDHVTLLRIALLMLR